MTEERDAAHDSQDDMPKQRRVESPTGESPTGESRADTRDEAAGVAGAASAVRVNAQAEAAADIVGEADPDSVAPRPATPETASSPRRGTRRADLFGLDGNGLLPDTTGDERDAGWGDAHQSGESRDAADLRRFLDEKPPHHM